MTRYPEDTPIAVEHFETCGWKQIFEGAEPEDYASMWQALSDAAKTAVESGRNSEGRVLWILADACSMMLRPASLNEPFTPMIVMDGRRSALPEDFPADEVQFLSAIYTRIDDQKLRGRIADLVWLLERPRNPAAAVAAIDSYRNVPITMDRWVRDGRECWDRAIQLCIMLRAGAAKRMQEIEEMLSTRLIQSAEADGYLALWIAELLSKHGLGRNRFLISQKLEGLAATFSRLNDLHRARDYFDAASDWYRNGKYESKAAEMTVRCAECWVLEAETRISGASPSHMVAVSFFESAIKKYRSVPRRERQAHRVDEIIDQLRTRLNESGELSLGEMGVIKSDPIDITELVNRARDSVRGKSAVEALRAFSNVYGGANAERIRAFSKELLAEHPLHALFSATHMSRDGRVIAKRPGADLTDAENEATVWPQMVKHYVMALGIVVQGNVWPALEVVRQEHRLKEGDFVNLAKESPIVPPGSERLIAKGLFLGYDNDFVSALHILIPQVESTIRYHLKRAGAKTTHLDTLGIETENGLSTLMELAEVGTIFEEDFAFEIRALFCDPFGPNLRNELAHGLLSFEDFQGVHAVYAWWFILRVVFNTFWGAQKRKNAGNTNAGNSVGDA
jgi:hypothetical protein